MISQKIFNFDDIQNVLKLNVKPKTEDRVHDDPEDPQNDGYKINCYFNSFRVIGFLLKFIDSISGIKLFDAGQMSNLGN